MVVASPEPARKALSQSQARTTGYSPRTQSSTPSTRAHTTGGSPRTPSSTPVWGAHDRRLSVHAVPDSKRAQPAARRLRARHPRFQACAQILRPVHDLASQLQPALEDLAGAMAPRVFLPAQPRSDMRASYLRVEGANPSGLPPRPRRRMWRRTLRKTCMAA